MKELVGKRCSAILSRRDVLGGGYPWFFDVLEVDMPMIKVDCWHDVRWIHADVIVTIKADRDTAPAKPRPLLLCQLCGADRSLEGCKGDPVQCVLLGHDY